MKDLDIVEEIENILGITLPILDRNEVLKYSRGYLLDINDNVTDVILRDSNLSDINRLSKPLSKLLRLTNLDLSSNHLTNVAFLKNIKTLNNLELSFNQIESLEQLKDFSNLNTLGLYENPITNVDALNGLKYLTNLNIGGTMIRSLSSLRNLTSLKHLYLHSNEIINIEVLQNLYNLNFLVLSFNPIKNISALKSLKKMRLLYMDSCLITDLSPLQELQDLEKLSVDNNRINDIDVIEYLPNLETLSVRNNNISDIKPLINHPIKTIFLAKNPLRVLPRELFERNIDVEWSETGHKEGFVYLYNNPIQNPPLGVVKQGKNAILRYYNKVEKEGQDYIYEAKLTLVGEGSAGKTSLLERLLKTNAQLPKSETRTRGIKISDWIFKKQKGKQHIAHIWDFGGQDVYFPVHRFFLTENSVFVLLASTRQTHHNFDYWIPTIFQFGGKSPIILGQTCHNGNTAAWTDLGYYIGHENFNIVRTLERPYYELNLVNNNEGLQEIKNVITAQLQQLSHYNQGVPSSWVQVRKELAKLAEDESCISYAEFKTLCKKINPNSFKQPIEIEDTANFFHSIGVALWYKNIADLKDWLILQPDWAMNAVYKIIDDEAIQKRNGHIIAADFDRLWSEECYEDKHSILKKMLEVFKIAFPKKHTIGNYIIPARLLSMPAEKRWPDDQPYLCVLYEYDFMPKGLVNQLSADLSRYITNDIEVWNNAVNFSYNNANCQIEEIFYKHKITLKAKGGKDSRTIIVMAMEALNQITEGYKGVKAEIIVPCTCKDCLKRKDPTTFNYEKLIEWSRKKAIVTCNESGDTLKIDELLYNVGLSNPLKEPIKKSTRKEEKRLFVSYSKHDEEYLQDFEEHLVTLKDEGKVSTFNCREIEFGKEWDAEIKQQIDECDIMVCLISVKFLNTDYIKKIEIEKAIEAGKTIVPIIIKPCDWESSVLGKYQAAQRGKVVSLNNLKLANQIKSHDEIERAAFWTDIIKEFRKKLFTE